SPVPMSCRVEFRQDRLVGMLGHDQTHNALDRRFAVKRLRNDGTRASQEAEATISVLGSFAATALFRMGNPLFGVALDFLIQAKEINEDLDFRAEDCGNDGSGDEIDRPVSVALVDAEFVRV